MSSGKCFVRSVVLALALILAGCSALDSPSLAVLRLYQALQNQDDEGYRASLDPNLRSQPDPFVLFDALRFGAGLEGIGLGAGREQLMQMSFGDLHYRTLDRTLDRAHVRVTGKLRLPTLGAEAPFCDEHLVTKMGGRWLVSYDEIEHTAKVDRWQQRWSQLVQEVNPSNFRDRLADMLDFCR